MLKGKQARILSHCCETIDRRVIGAPEPMAKMFAVTWMEGAVSAFVFAGKNDLAESAGRMMGEIQASLSWAQFRQKQKS